MADVAVYGTVAADIVVRVPVIPRSGDHIRAEPLGWRLGGSSANVACALAAAGHRVQLISVIGTDPLAESLVAELERRGVDTGPSVRVEGPAPRALILLDPAGERTILGLDIGSVTDSLPLTSIPDIQADALYVESYRRYPASIADRARDCLVVATPPASDSERWPADVLVGSERQYTRDWDADPLRFAGRVAGDRLRWVVVTRGPNGADAFGRGATIHVPARPATQIDATGAGDAFAAGLIGALLAGRSMRDAMEVAVEEGARAVEVLQSVPPGWIDGARME